MKDIKNSNLEFRKIKSLHFLYEVNENGTIFRNVKSKKQSKIILDMHHTKTGYYKTSVRFKGKTKRVMMHRVVAECWHGQCPEGLQVDHIDRNSRNNDFRNLRYVTHSEQMKNRTLSKETLLRVRENCLKHSLEVLAIPIVITNDSEKLNFRSMTQCAEFLANKYNTTVETERGKLKNRRHHIHDYDIIYSKCRD